MQVIYPYNEILPKKKAHDVFVVHECAALAALGWEITLLVGKGSDNNTLLSHYGLTASEKLHIQQLFIVRKNNPFGISWNLPFFFGCQRQIRANRPDYVITSVLKQAAFHLFWKLPQVRYVYEAHELRYYPTSDNTKNYELKLEKMVLSRMDRVIVTTEALKEILLNPPYSLKNRVDVVPLAVNATRLGPPPSADPLILMYIGQLYAGQGLPLLLAALADISRVQLKILGGTPEEIHHLARLAQDLAITDSVEFLGFVPPHKIAKIAESAHAFVAPFESVGRMPYVAHTKLMEYAEWGRPIIAPRLPIVTEHFQDGKGVLLFEAGQKNSLAGCIAALKQDSLRQKLQEEMAAYSGRFSWAARAQAYKALLT